MKQLLHKGLALGLAALMLTGCGAPASPSTSPGASSAASASSTASTSSAPAGSSAAPQSQPGTTQVESPLLDDGQLRLFFHSKGSCTVFCGDQILLTVPENGIVTRLGGSGNSDYFSVTLPEVGQESALPVIYDKTGTVLYTCTESENYLDSIADWVLLGRTEYPFATPHPTKLLRLTDGKICDGPECAVSLFLLPDGTMLVQAYDASYERPVLWHYDADGQALEHWEGVECYGDPDYGDALWETDAKRLLFYKTTEQPIGHPDLPPEQFLYSFSDGTLYENYYSILNDRYICCAQPDADADSAYAVIDLFSGQTVYTCAEPCEQYLVLGPVEYLGYDRSFSYRLQLTTGETLPLRTYTTNTDGGCTVLTEDQLMVYTADGELLFCHDLPAFSPPDNAERSIYGLTPYVMPNGETRVLLSCSYFLTDSGFSPDYCAVFDQSGILFQTDVYNGISPMAGGYLHGWRSTAGGRTVDDLLDPDGQVLLSGVQSVSSVDGLDNVWALQSGFTEGWMDSSGNWLWSCSIWQGASDEGSAYYY